MMEAMRILNIVLPHPKRTIVAGHWSGEEQGSTDRAPSRRTTKKS